MHWFSLQVLTYWSCLHQSAHCVCLVVGWAKGVVSGYACCVLDGQWLCLLVCCASLVCCAVRCCSLTSERVWSRRSRSKEVRRMWEFLLREPSSE